MNGIYRALGPDGFGVYSVDCAQGRATFKHVETNSDRLLIPGFVDIHIHGAFGIDFMSASSADLTSLCDRLKEEGYAGFLPTTVTASPEAVAAAIGCLPENPMILGFHLEGPFISPKYPGAQPQAFILEPPAGPSPWDKILNDPRLRVTTIAPEIPGALGLIQRLSRRQVRVGMGHTNATYEEARKGFEAGASHTTHTYNAMRPLHHREAGTVGYALQNDDLACELIYDRLHVCKEAAALLLRNKPADKVIGISDGTKAAGLTPGAKLDMWGNAATKGVGDVRLEDGTLAGSAVTLRQVFQNLREDFGEETAIRTCCLNPRKLLGLGEEPRVWIELDRDGKIQDRIEV